MRKYTLLLLGLCLLTFASIAAQPAATECPDLVQEALARLDTTCAGLGRNSICYGNTRVSVTFNHEIPDDVFDTPSDMAEIKDIEQVQTAPLDESLNQWGLALMNVQANVPGTLPGQGVVYVLMGDAVLQNKVDPANLPDPSKAIQVVAVNNANIRSAPGLKANVLGSVAASTTLTADAKSVDGQWLRVLYNDLPAWINLEVVTTSGDLDALPILNSTEQSPMQAFQFSGGIGNPTCSQAQGTLLIQGPEGVVVNLEANGARISLASTILLTQRDQKLSFTTLSGAAKVNDVIIPAGFTTSTSLNEFNEVLDDFTGLEALSDEDFADFDFYEDIDSELFYYDIDLDEAEANTEELDIEDLDLEDFDFDLDDLCLIDPTAPDCDSEGNLDEDLGDVPDDIETDLCILDPTSAECTDDDEGNGDIDDAGDVEVDPCVVDPLDVLCTGGDGDDGGNDDPGDGGGDDPGDDGGDDPGDGGGDDPGDGGGDDPGDGGGGGDEGEGGD